ncbi:N-acetylmuramidase domain-containing protein [Chelativorans sp. AA-79]|uniref:N-acetylmuramidase domain-containing protein n=1 Tax=Chelativorans sp. AA-79 TaxID=3028735 RepID=UPI0023F95DC3|nr:N-acetylmuramidase domain-containing protein [Chelativorans sp. AA-79]WEX10372.1 N-acetylmuramidase domain-containing protein [Chelativorans sp. AA-79]
MFTAETIDLIARAAREARLEPATLLAVIEVESGGRTHAVVQGRPEPLIRFEGHYFDRRLSPADQEMARREGLASPTAGAVKNPPSQAARWRMLGRAAEIDRRAAYESTSWGVGQVMGAHWKRLGYPSVDALVEEARGGVEGQIRLMLRYIDEAGLMEALHRRDWTAFARGYNGPGFARNSYHLKLALAYRRHARAISRPGSDAPAETPALLRRGDRGSAVQHLQRLLTAAGHPVTADGDFGPRTHAAVLAFQRSSGLTADGIAGPATMEALQAALPFGSPASVWRRLVKLWQRLGRLIA